MKRQRLNRKGQHETPHETPHETQHRRQAQQEARDSETQRPREATESEAKGLTQERAPGDVTVTGSKREGEGGTVADHSRAVVFLVFFAGVVLDDLLQLFCFSFFFLLKRVGSSSVLQVCF